MFASLFQSLSNSLGFGQQNHPSDVSLTRHKFASLGWDSDSLDKKDMDEGLDRTIRNFQKDKGLKIDGVMNPLGDTENALNEGLSDRLKELFGNDTKKSGKVDSVLKIEDEPSRPKANVGIAKSLPMLMLGNEVGNNKGNAHSDMTDIQEQLAGLGYLPERHAKQPDLYITKPIEDAIRKFQVDNNLKNDGWAGPKGETEKALNRRVSEVISETKKPKMPKSFEELINPKEQMSYPPSVNDAAGRQEAILEQKPAIFDIETNPKATSKKPWYAMESSGLEAIKEHGGTIETMAKKHGVDPDLVKAVMWSENARGGYWGGGELYDKIGLSKTKMPMNINGEMWRTLVSKNTPNLDKPEDNIEAGVVLLKRIGQRVKHPTPAKIGAIWEGLPREHTDDYSTYIERIYKEKPWQEK